MKKWREQNFREDRGRIEDDEGEWGKMMSRKKLRDLLEQERRYPRKSMRNVSLILPKLGLDGAANRVIH
jgi:hypothetical protein